MLPGAGSLIAMVETATQTPPIFIGKPEAIIMDKAVAHLGLPKEEVIMVEITMRRIFARGFGMALIPYWYYPVLHRNAVPRLPEPQLMSLIP